MSCFDSIFFIDFDIIVGEKSRIRFFWKFCAPREQIDKLLQQLENVVSRATVMYAHSFKTWKKSRTSITIW